MAAPALYTATRDFLVGNSGDVRYAVNTDLGSTVLAEGSVYAVRASSRAGRPAKLNALPVVVEVGLSAPGAPRDVGVGRIERTVAVRLSVYVKLMDDSTGDDQVAQLEQICRALEHRYAGVSKLTLTATGATFVEATAQTTSVDERPDLRDAIAGSVAAFFTWEHAAEAN